MDKWIANYDTIGPSGLVNKHINNRYSVELKNSAVETYLQGEGGRVEICKRYCIRSRAQLMNWIKHGLEWIKRSIYVLDRYHLSKYVT